MTALQISEMKTEDIKIMVEHYIMMFLTKSGSPPKEWVNIIRNCSSALDKRNIVLELENDKVYFYEV